MKAFISLLAFLMNVQAAHALAACESSAHARSLYQAGEVADALNELKCLKQKNPGDVDTERLLSDIYWWEGFTAASSLEAAAGFQLLNGVSSDFEDTKIHLADRLKRVQLRANFAQLSANQSSGQNYSLELDDRYAGKQHLLLGLYRTSRIYTGGVKISDFRYELGHLFTFGKTGYWENSVSYSPEAKIFARSSLSTTPHWVSSNGFDFYVNLRFSHYLTDVKDAADVGSTSVGFTRALNNSFVLGLQTMGIHTSHWLSASQASLTFLPSNRLAFRGGLAFGHAVEGPGLEGDFRAYLLDLRVRLDQSLALIPNAEIYRGSVRSETGFGLSAEARF